MRARRRSARHRRHRLREASFAEEDTRWFAGSWKRGQPRRPSDSSLGSCGTLCQRCFRGERVISSPPRWMERGTSRLLYPLSPGRRSCHCVQDTKTGRLALLRKDGRPAASAAGYHPIGLLDEAGKILERIAVARIVPVHGRDGSRSLGGAARLSEGP